MRTMRHEIRDNLSYSMIKAGVFTRFKNVIIYAEEKDDNIVRNIVIYTRPRNETEKNMLAQARSATINKNIVTLRNGNFQQFNEDEKNSPDILFFEKYILDLNDISEDKTETYMRPDTLSIIQLFYNLKNYDKENLTFSKNKLIYEINYRLSFPLLSVIMALLSGSLVLNNSFSRTTNIKVMLKTSVISVSTYLLLLSIYQKVEKNTNFIFVQFIVISAILILCVRLLKERNV
jgi:lipopolysaccharide export LptBFGC system permease protein LptF